MQDDSGAIGVGADAVCEALRVLGVTNVFGVPSQQNLALYRALSRHSAVRVIGSRHEQGAVHAADGYARSTGKLGVAIASTGPGTANAVAGLYEASFASSPVLLLTTQVDSCWLGRGKGFIHEAERQLPMLQSVTRRSETVRHPEEIGATILEVARDILSGRAQPGAVEIPTDFLSRPTSFRPLVSIAPTEYAPDSAAIGRAVDRLVAAQRPLLWVGGGAQGAAAEICDLQAKLRTPVVSSVNGRGVISSNHPMYLGCQTQSPEFRSLLNQADVVLAVGTRFQPLATGFWSLPVHNLIHIDADPGVIGRNYEAELGIVSDARRAVAGILAALPEKLPQREDWVNKSSATKVALQAASDASYSPQHLAVVRIIDEILGEKRNVVGDATLVSTTWGNHRLAVRDPRSAFVTTSMAIGPALPLGLGVAVGNGFRTLILHGDGGVMLSLGELACAVEHRLPIILCIFNDRGYGTLRLLTGDADDRARLGLDLHTPDFVAVGEGFGVPSARASSPEEFERALRSATHRDGPSLIEVDLQGFGILRW